MSAQPFPLPPPAATIASPPHTPVNPPRPSLAAMDASLLPPVTVEVTHTPSPRADLVGGHVGPAVAQASVAPARKRQGNVVVQGGNLAAPAAKDHASSANAAARSRPAAESPRPRAARGRGFRLQTRRLLHPLTPSRKQMPRRCSSMLPLPPPSKDKIAKHRYKDMKASEGKFFKLEHCWELLQKCEKWKLIGKESPPKRGSLTDMDEYVDDDGPINLNKPNGDKKTKEKMKREQEASSLREKIDAMMQSNELMFLKSLEIKKELAEKKAKEKQEKWQLLKEEGIRKAAIKERRACAAENKSMSLFLVEENKIMSMNHDDMDNLTKTWHDMARREILKKRMVASAGPCYSFGDVFSAPYGGNVDDFGAGVGTSAGGGFGGADEPQDGLDGAE
ncbi:Lactation elevated protein 1 [Hordeum vulgare]|nr:Lactation elevated protein 1 [Hordeum vulgare]